MGKFSRILSFILIPTFFCGMFTACYDKRELDDQAYVIALGFDEGKTNYLRITLQIAKPGAIAGESSGGSGAAKGAGGTAGKPFMITTVEAPTLYSALNMVNTYVSRQINMSTTIALIFSKSLAEKGLEYLVNAVLRQRELRPSIYVVVSRTTAEEYINNVTPILERNPVKYYYLNYTGYRYTSFTANTQLSRFSAFMGSQDRQPVAILAGVSKNNTTEDINTDNSTYREKGRTFPFEGDFKAGDVPRTGEDKGEIMGLAVFDGEKMAGELDGEETGYYLLMTGEYRNAFWTIPDPKVKDRFVLLNIRQNRMPEKEVTLVNGKPKINVRLFLEADILSIQSGLNYETGQNTVLLEDSVKAFLEAGAARLLHKTAAEYHSDIFGFGSAIRSHYLTWNEFEAVHWKKIYKASDFNVEIMFKIRRPGLLIRSSKSIDSNTNGGMQY